MTQSQFEMVQASGLESPFSGLSFSVYFFISRKILFFLFLLASLFTIKHFTYSLRAEAIFFEAAAKNYKTVMKKYIESRFLNTKSYFLNLQQREESNKTIFLGCCYDCCKNDIKNSSYFSLSQCSLQFIYVLSLQTHTNEHEKEYLMEAAAAFAMAKLQITMLFFVQDVPMRNFGFVTKFCLSYMTLLSFLLVASKTTQLFRLRTRLKIKNLVFLSSFLFLLNHRDFFK